jgi:integrase
MAGRCLEILKLARAMYPSSDLIFPGTKTGSALSDMTFTKVLRDIGYSAEATPHGMRSAFKDWCAEVAKVADEVSEAALAHKIPEKVRAAYLRTVFLEERKKFMAWWAEYCASKLPP